MKWNFIVFTLVATSTLFANEIAGHQDHRLGQVVAYRRIVKIDLEKCKANFTIEMPNQENPTTEPHGSCTVLVNSKDVLAQYETKGTTYDLDETPAMRRVFFHASPQGYRFSLFGKADHMNWAYAAPLFEKLLQQNKLGASYTVDLTRVE